MSTTAVVRDIRNHKFTKGELANMKRDAYISPCKKYRYYLTRVWDEDLPRLVYVLLNPSTADAIEDDPTVKKCMGFARMYGFGSIEIVNLFAYRTTFPKELKKLIRKHGEEFAVGPENDEYIKEAVERSELVIVGWGNNGKGFKRRKEVMELLRDKEVICLGSTKEDQPRHPLMLAYATELENYID